jgi:hypothetical protein
MDFTTCYCPHPQHALRQTGFDAHLVRCGVDRGIPRLLCTMCQGYVFGPLGHDVLRCARGGAKLQHRDAGVGRREFSAGYGGIVDKIPSVTGWIVLGGIVGLSLPICSTPYPGMEPLRTVPTVHPELPQAAHPRSKVTIP